MSTNKNENQNKASFLNRIPKQINAKELEDGRYLLPKENREQIAKLIKEKGKRNVWTSIQTKYGEREFYIDKQGQAYVKGPLLGKGAFGKVHVVQNAITGKWQCMKILKSGALENSELEILAQEGMYVSSESIKKSFDLFVGELIHGKGLDEVINKNKMDHELSFEQLLAMGLSLTEAYESLHRKGFVHRDIKQENVMFDSDQRKCIAIDFGAVADTTKARGIAGTIYYVSLETLEADSKGIALKPSAKDDIYALGLTLGELFSSMTNRINYQDEAEGYFKNSPELQKRHNYTLSMDKFWNLSGKYDRWPNYDGIADEAHSGISHVLLGAHSELYQQRKKLSKEQIDLFKTIYNMSGEIEGRPSLLKTIQEIQRIRLEHIKKRMTTIPSSEYKKLLEDLFAKRDSLRNAPGALDDLDSFLLRMVDSKLNNRPSLNEVQNYRNNLILGKMTREKLSVEIQAVPETEARKLKSSKESLENIAQKFRKLEIIFTKNHLDLKLIRELQSQVEPLHARIEKNIKSNSVLNAAIYREITKLLMAYVKLRDENVHLDENLKLEKIDEELKDLFTTNEELENLLTTLDKQSKILANNPIAMELTKVLKDKITIVKNQVEQGIKSKKMVEDAVYDEVKALTEIVKHHNNTVNLKTVVKELIDKNSKYLQPYRSGQKSKKERKGTLIFANKAGKYDNAEKLEIELTKLMKKDILDDPELLQKLIQKYKVKDLKTMGRWSSSKDSGVAKMFKEAEESLAVLASSKATAEWPEMPVPKSSQDKKPKP